MNLKTYGTDNLQNREIPWINPVGGLGDMLMVSGVLKLVHDTQPTRQFNLVRRTQYRSIFKGHPAIREIGHPPKEAELLRVDYWYMEKLGPGAQRPFQILARGFGLKTPVEERLYLPGDGEKDPLLHEMIPWKKNNVLIATTSQSPRKAFKPAIWERFVEELALDGTLVLQAGVIQDRHIRGAYSLLGITTPRQMIPVIKRCDLVVTVDNFIMHAAHLAGTPAVVIWGPTQHEVFGYPEQTHLQMPKMCDLDADEDCIGPSRNEGGKIYSTACPLGDDHCIDQLDWKTLYEEVKDVMIPGRNPSPASTPA